MNLLDSPRPSSPPAPSLLADALRAQAVDVTAGRTGSRRCRRPGGAWRR